MSSTGKNWSDHAPWVITIIVSSLAMASVVGGMQETDESLRKGIERNTAEIHDLTKSSTALLQAVTEQRVTVQSLVKGYEDTSGRLDRTEDEIQRLKVEAARGYSTNPKSYNSTGGN